MEICKIEKITNCKHLNLFSIQYRDRKKNKKNWMFASRSDHHNPFSQTPGLPDAVVVVPFHKQEEKLVIIREFRVALGGYQYGFPAGLVDKGESIIHAGKRELFEETGLEVTKILKQSPCIYSSSGMTDESISLLFVECRGKPSNEFNELSEDIEVVLLSRKEASMLMEEPDLKFDVKSWIVISMFANYGIIS
ncbi:MAG: DNA mismatch repair protein MutT [Desulfobacteraceae bacterium 4572_89]|nr:MAG: DNA mismatch repair protein MutT [Desulfobacteraceae bacterium 4572_89]